MRECFARDGLFVGEAGTSKYGHCSESVATHKVASLDHESLDHSVECALLVSLGNIVDSVFSGAKLAKVLACFGQIFRVQLELDAADALAIVGHVQKRDGHACVL